MTKLASQKILTSDLRIDTRERQASFPPVQRLARAAWASGHLAGVSPKLVDR